MFVFHLKSLLVFGCVLMTFYGNFIALSEVIIVSKDKYRSHTEHMNYQIQYSLNMIQNNKKCVESDCVGDD